MTKIITEFVNSLTPAELGELAGECLNKSGLLLETWEAFKESMEDHIFERLMDNVFDNDDFLDAQEN